MTGQDPGPLAGFHWNADCREFVGGYPCRRWRACPGCEHYDPVDRRVLIVMLDLLGDMLIASPLPARIKRDHPGTHITWLASAASVPMLAMNPHIDRVLAFDWQAAETLLGERYDAVYSFERTPAAASLVERIDAAHKAGLAWGGERNGLYPIGEAARHFFAMNTWNDFRTRGNTKTWTELYFEVAGYAYHGEPYELAVPDTAQQSVRGWLGEPGWVCLNVGASLPTKIWPPQQWLALGQALLAGGHRLVLTGGPADTERCLQLQRDLDDDRVRFRPLSLQEFAAVPSLCAVMVTGDSLGFHLALAHDIPVVVLLGPSNGAEVIPKDATTITAVRSLLACSPCAHQVTCGGVGGCMDTITTDQVHRAVTAALHTREQQEQP
ncbi:glycosyltransferase family 9 protein [Nocardia sp. alder85J]|uniref:glycosyltransferase family 9 protein n=1 Tax=Nocardia sp. alder85J TaxID=2862949 RepID=UPI001CD205FC|nr:glycosyltransferase family 9 protein [Nocardia sp. alder85J]MCX4094564.1 glycosyltransferase family 9 protein [Nocardia sp. alder85J]